MDASAANRPLRSALVTTTGGAMPADPRVHRSWNGLQPSRQNSGVGGLPGSVSCRTAVRVRTAFSAEPTRTRGDNTEARAQLRSGPYPRRRQPSAGRPIRAPSRSATSMCDQDNPSAQRTYSGGTATARRRPTNSLGSSMTLAERVLTSAPCPRPCVVNRSTFSRPFTIATLPLSRTHWEWSSSAHFVAAALRH